MAETTPDRDAVVAVITAMYEALGDRERFDAHLDPEVVMWETDADRLLRGLSELDALRDVRRSRAAGEPRPTTVTPEVVAADVWDDTGVVRYELRARYGDGRPDDVFRVTDVLRRAAGTWRIVHHHAERYV